METARKNINWHSATVAALQIDLRDFSDLLTFDSEAYLWNKRFRLDLVIIHKNTDISIPKPLADQFRSANLFEIKGIGSGVTIQSFYKVLGYAGLYASENWNSSAYGMNDIALFLLSRSRPNKLIEHLREDCGFDVANISPGIYYIGEAGFPIHIIVTRMLPPEEYLYLYCVAKELKKQDLQYVEQLEKDYLIHHNDEPKVYGNYILQIRNAYGKAKEGATMAAAKKVKNIYDMNIVELAQENERQKNIYDMNIVELVRENERQKNIYDMNIVELARENERQKSIYDANISELIRKNEKTVSRLTEQIAREKDIFDTNISELVQENEKILSKAAAYKQRITELEEQIRKLSKQDEM